MEYIATDLDIRHPNERYQVMCQSICANHRASAHALLKGVFVPEETLMSYLCL